MKRVVERVSLTLAEERVIGQKLSREAFLQAQVDRAAVKAVRPNIITDEMRRDAKALHCPRIGCGGRVLEDQEHSLYCINCGWRQESPNPRHNLDYIRKMFFRGQSHITKPKRGRPKGSGKKALKFEVPSVRHGGDERGLADDGGAWVQSSLEEYPSIQILVRPRSTTSGI